MKLNTESFFHVDIDKFYIDKFYLGEIFIFNGVMDIALFYSHKLISHDVIFLKKLKNTNCIAIQHSSNDFGNILFSILLSLNLTLSKGKSYRTKSFNESEFVERGVTKIVCLKSCI